MQGLVCHFISMLGKSPTKLEVTFRYDHSCLMGHKASTQTKKNTNRWTSSHGLPTRAAIFPQLKYWDLVLELELLSMQLVRSFHEANVELYIQCAMDVCL